MLRITLEIVPFGEESRKRTLGICEIANECTGTHEIGNYKAAIFGEDHLDKSIKNIDKKDLSDVFRYGKIKNFKRELGHWELVKKTLNKLLKEKKAKCVK